MRWLFEHVKRIIRITAGVVVLLAGIVLMVPGIPGPGFVLVFLGLSILAMDFVWAHRLKTKMKDTAGMVVDKVRGKPTPEGGRARPPGAPSESEAEAARRSAPTNGG